MSGIGVVSGMHCMYGRWYYVYEEPDHVVFVFALILCWYVILLVQTPDQVFVC